MAGNRQHGFNKGESCTANLVSSCDEITDPVDKGRAVDAIYLYFKKSFDKVFHRIFTSNEIKYVLGKWMIGW